MSSSDDESVDSEQPLINLKVLSPSTEVSGDLIFPSISPKMTVGELKVKIRDAVPTHPSIDRQRLIYRGRVMADNDATMEGVFGTEALKQSDSHTLHLVLRELVTAPRAPAVVARPQSQPQLPPRVHNHNAPTTQSVPQAQLVIGPFQLPQLPGNLGPNIADTINRQVQQQIHQQLSQQINQQLAAFRAQQAATGRNQANTTTPQAGPTAETVGNGQTENNQPRDQFHQVIAQQQQRAATGMQGVGANMIRSHMQGTNEEGNPELQLAAQRSQSQPPPDRHTRTPSVTRTITRATIGPHEASWTITVNNTITGGSTPAHAPGAPTQSHGPPNFPPLPPNFPPLPPNFPPLPPMLGNNGTNIGFRPSSNIARVTRDLERELADIQALARSLNQGNTAGTQGSGAQSEQSVATDGQAGPRLDTLQNVAQNALRQINQFQNELTTMNLQQARAQQSLNSLTSVNDRLRYQANDILRNINEARASLPQSERPIFERPHPIEHSANGIQNQTRPLAGSTSAAGNPAPHVVSASTQTQVYLLSSPAGPYALLVSPSGTYRTNVQPNGAFNHVLPPNVQGNLPPLINLAQNANPPLAADNGALDPPEFRINIRAAIGPLLAHFWLLVRIFGFIYVFSGGSRWQFLVLGLIGSILFLVQVGLFRDRFQAIRRHFDTLLPQALPPANRPVPVNQQPANPDVTGRVAQSVPTPEDTAQRLIRERETRNRNSLYERLRAVERSTALFLASLWPGLGERFVNAEREAETARAAAEAAAREAAEAERSKAAETRDEEKPEGSGSTEESKAGESSNEVAQHHTDNSSGQQ
ncbi:hypothetical protein M501DRAFT_994651 [Patellaria atrata CBS 101060]|uniref:Ubiquitin-like domain-containing protein n=1 Tax=Patellaria atrata CBS 101060 TaxID=1346257 RepID=A0A9P4SIM9_9PEZI|nr:hypothetical protein M501DRAFT_994651 [Patellaria atrata CBS 101060]